VRPLFLYPLTGWGEPTDGIARGVPASRAVLTDGGKAAVLVVDDDPVVRRVIVEVLGREAFDVTVVATALEALEEVRRGTPDVIILDIELPGMSGLELLLRLRQGDCPPVILLTGRSDESDRVLGLDLGADDYVVKPFLPRELAARVRGVLRRQAEAPAASASVPGAVRLDYGSLVIAPLEREVHLHGDLIDLTPREYELLVHLARHPRQVFTREELLDQVWGSKGDWQDPATVTEHVRRLRTKIETDPSAPRWLTTVRGVGYRFEPVDEPS
jgi:two-component system phosphate regulon response regulator PhoB